MTLRDRSQMTSAKRGGGQPKLTKGYFKERKIGKSKHSSSIKGKLCKLTRCLKYVKCTFSCGSNSINTAVCLFVCLSVANFGNLSNKPLRTPGWRQVVVQCITMCCVLPTLRKMKMESTAKP